MDEKLKPTAWLCTRDGADWESTGLIIRNASFAAEYERSPQGWSVTPLYSPDAIESARASGYAAGIADAAEVAEKWERQPVGIRSFRDPDDDGWLDIELIFEEGRAEHLIAAAIRALSTSKGE